MSFSLLTALLISAAEVSGPSPQPSPREAGRGSQECDAADSHGHEFATCFDPWQGLELGGGMLVDSAQLTTTGGFTGGAHAALRFRGERESRSKAESTWLSLHRIAATEVRPVQGRFALSLQGYTGIFRRHVREGTLLLPFNPPVTVPFPLDMTFMAEVLKYERRVADGNGSDWALEPVRLSFLLDPIRSASSRFHLSLGVTAAWRLVQNDAVIFHEVTPLSAATLFFDFESEDGLWLTRGILSGGWSLQVGAPTMKLRARGELEVARTLFAINNQPLSLYLRASGAWRDAGARGSSEWSAQVGLQLRLFSAR